MVIIDRRVEILKNKIGFAKTTKGRVKKRRKQRNSNKGILPQLHHHQFLNQL
jgi:hypothetical protein